MTPVAWLARPPITPLWGMLWPFRSNNFRLILPKRPWMLWSHHLWYVHYSFSGISHSHAVVRTCTRCACEWIWVSWDCQDVAGFLNLSHTWRIVTSITWSCCFVNFLYHVYASYRAMLQVLWNQAVITCWFKPRWQWLINIQITSRFHFFSNRIT